LACELRNGREKRGRKKRRTYGEEKKKKKNEKRLSRWRPPTPLPPVPSNIYERQGSMSKERGGKIIHSGRGKGKLERESMHSFFY